MLLGHVGPKPVMHTLKLHHMLGDAASADAYGSLQSSFNISFWVLGGRAEVQDA